MQVGGRGLALGKLGLFFFFYGELSVALTVLSLAVKYGNTARWKELSAGYWRPKS